MPSGHAQRSLGWLLLLVAPGLWVMAVLGLGFALDMGVQFAPLLAAAPAIACAGTGRKLCVTLGCACALLALAPLPGQPAAVGERIGTASAVLAVTIASYLVVRRRLRMQQAYDEVRQIAEVTQRVLLRPIPERIGPVATAVEYLSAATGAHVGGDFYEVIDTPYGVRAILGDMRGNGLDALSGAAALLGAFREAGAVEPTLEAVAARLDAALTRHTTGARRVELIVARRDEFHGAAGDGGGWGLAERESWGEVGSGTRSGGVRVRDEAQLWAEDFATAVLVQIPDERMGNVTVNEARLVVCGHPSPYLIRDDRTVPVVPDRPALPLGLGSLIDEPYAGSSSVVPFEPGDALVFYTDGVSDARDRTGEFFGLEELLCGRDGLDGRAPQFVAATVRSRLLEHTDHELNDDAALLVLGRLGGDS